MHQHADPEVGLAVAAAKMAAGHMSRGGRSKDWREYLGAAWQGVRTRREKSLRSGLSGVFDYMRSGAGGYKTRTGRVRQPKPFAALDSPPDRPARVGRPTPLGLWCEARLQRTRGGWDWRSRLYVYLHAVEGLTLAEVGACFGLTQQAVRNYLHANCPAWRDRRNGHLGG